MHRFATALLVSGLGIGAVPAMASAQSGIGSIGSILLPSVPSGVYYPTTGTAHGKKNGNAKREYIDAAGCKVKEQSKPDGDYKYERNCKHADKNLAKAQKSVYKKSKGVYNGDPRRDVNGVYGTDPRGVIYGGDPRRSGVYGKDPRRVP